MNNLNLVLSQYPEGKPFYEFDIDNQMLSSILQVDSNSLNGIFSLESSDSGYFVAQIGKFTGKLDTEKVMLYVCSHCGDIGCGAITVKITFNENSIIWSDFKYENTYETWEEYPKIGPFEFKKKQYLEEFKKMIKNN